MSAATVDELIWAALLWAAGVIWLVGYGLPLRRHARERGGRPSWTAVRVALGFHLGSSIFRIVTAAVVDPTGVAAGVILLFSGVLLTLAAERGHRLHEARRRAEIAEFEALITADQRPTRPER